MAKTAQPSLQAGDAFTITPSDTVNIKSDPGNTNNYGFCYVHNAGTGGTVRVLPADQPDTGTPVTVYIAQGATLPMQIKRVYATTPAPPSPLVAFIGRGGSF